MCETSRFARSPENFMVKLKVPSGFCVALKVAVPGVLIGGTSLSPFRRAVRVNGSSSEVARTTGAALMTLKQNTTAKANNTNFFIVFLSLSVKKCQVFAKTTFFEGDPRNLSICPEVGQMRVLQAGFQ